MDNILDIKSIIHKAFKVLLFVALLGFVLYLHNRSFTRSLFYSTTIDAAWQSDSSWGTNWIMKP